jgi:hypothetical protein
MKMLLYSEKEDDKTEFLTRETEDLVWEEPIEVCQTIEALRHRLTRLGSSPDIAVIMVREKKELKMIVSLKDLLADVRTIVILPDREEDTISQGHKLYPRFLTYMDSDFGEVAAVLKKMMANYAMKEVQGQWWN